MFRKLLIPHDLSACSKDALSVAIEFALKYGASLDIFHSINLDRRLISYGVVPNREQAAQQITQELQDDLNNLIKTKGSKQELSHKITLKWGEPVQSLLDHIVEEQPDLVVMGTHGHTGLKHFFLGSCTEKMIQLSPAPVMIVRNRMDRFKRLLVPIDFSESTEDALLLVSHLMALGIERVDLLHVVALSDLALMSHDLVVAQNANLMKELMHHASLELDELIKDHPSLPFKKHVKMGQPAHEIIQMATDSHTDLILMPTHGESGLAHLIMGSVTEKVTRHAPTNVLTFCPKRSREVRLNRINKS